MYIKNGIFVRKVTDAVFSWIWHYECQSKSPYSGCSLPHFLLQIKSEKFNLSYTINHHIVRKADPKAVGTQESQRHAAVICYGRKCSEYWESISFYNFS